MLCFKYNFRLKSIHQCFMGGKGKRIKIQALIIVILIFYPCSQILIKSILSLLPPQITKCHRALSFFFLKKKFKNWLLIFHLLV